MNAQPTPDLIAEAESLGGTHELRPQPGPIISREIEFTRVGLLFHAVSFSPAGRYSQEGTYYTSDLK